MTTRESDCARLAAALKLAEAIRSPMWSDDCGQGCVVCRVTEGVLAMIRREREGRGGDEHFPHSPDCAWVAWAAIAAKGATDAS